MAKKRKSENAALDEVERTLYTSFCTAANSISQLYTQAQNQQKLSFQAGERHAVVSMSITRAWIVFVSHVCGFLLLCALSDDSAFEWRFCGSRPNLGLQAHWYVRELPVLFNWMVVAPTRVTAAVPSNHAPSLCPPPSMNVDIWRCGTCALIWLSLFQHFHHI